MQKRHEVHIVYKPEGTSIEREKHMIPFSDAEEAHKFADRQRKREDVHSVDVKSGGDECQASIIRK